MLDQDTSAAPEGEGPGKGPPATEPHYVPPEKAAALTGHSPAPKVKRFSRKALGLMSAIGVGVIALALSVGLQTPKLKVAPPPDNVVKAPAPGDRVNSIPTTYQEAAAEAPKLGPPGSGDFRTGIGGAVNGTGGPAGAQQLTPLQQYLQQRELERIKREDGARSAGVGFTGGDTGGASARPAGLVATSASVDPAAALSDRLLDAAGRAMPGASGGTSGRDEDNRQDDKNSFADKDRSTDFDLRHGLQMPRSPYTLFAGTIVPCIMMQGINSDLPGQISCMVSQNVYDTVTGKYLLLPQGTKAIGTYDSRISYGQSRVLVVWTRLLRPDGSSIALEGMPGTDLSGYAGLTGRVNNHYMRLLGGVVLGSIIGAGAQVAAGANAQNPSFSQLAVQGVGQNINQAGQQITRKNLNIQPTIEVKPGERLNIFATKDLILPAYNQ